MELQDRKYQEIGVEKIRKSIRDGNRRIMFVLSTGGGKTLVACMIMALALDKEKRILFLGHRREIINQTRDKLIRFGVSEQKLGMVMAGVKSKHRNPVAPVQIASIDTIRNKANKPPADIVFVDECFPAGTLIDGRPIESIRVGDYVSSYCEETRTVEYKRVTRLFAREATSSLVTVRTGSGEVTCTPEHPIFTGCGYTTASRLKRGDMLYGEDLQLREVWQTGREEDLVHRADALLLDGLQEGADEPAPEGAGRAMQGMRQTGHTEGPRSLQVVDATGLRLLLDDVPQDVRWSDLGEEYGRHEPTSRAGAHAPRQPDVEARNQREDESYAATDRSPADGERRQWQADLGATKDACRSARVGDRVCRTDEERDAPAPLQDRHRERGGHDRDRGGRVDTQYSSQKAGRPSQGRLSPIARVDRVEVHEPGSPEWTRLLRKDSRVFNLEVEDNHNYFANGFLVHNCHRSLARSWVRLMEAYPNAIIIGLTATPWRADGKGFEMTFDDLVVCITTQELIDLGYLSQPLVFTGPAEHIPDLSSVRTKGGDYDEQQLAIAVDKSALIGDIVEHWGRLADHRRTVCFAVNITHSKHIVDVARAAGIRAEHVDGTMAVAEREAILRRLHDGDTEFVSNVNVLGEGWDEPRVKCLVQARPTKSISLHLQQCGRVLRPWNNIIPIILDHARNAIEFGLPQDEREYTLEAPSKKRRAGASTVPVKTCPPPCYAVLSAHVRECPVCGHVFQPEEPLPETADGKLVEYSIEHRRKVWEELCAKEQAAGGPDGWAFQMYRNKFKAPPPKDFRPLSVPKFTEEDKRSYVRWLVKRAREEARGQRWIYAVYRGKFNEDPPLEIVRQDEGRVQLAEGQDAEQKTVDWVI